MNEPRSFAYYEALQRRLRLLDPLVAELAPERVSWYREFLDVGEYGLAVEMAAEWAASEMARDRVGALAAALLAEAEVMSLSLSDALVVALRQLAQSG